MYFREKQNKTVQSYNTFPWYFDTTYFFRDHIQTSLLMLNKFLNELINFYFPLKKLENHRLINPFHATDLF